MHVLIIEAVLSGHHAIYLERIAAAYMDAGHVVTLTVLKRDIKHTGIGRLTSKYGSLFNVVPLDDAKYQAAFHSALGESGRELALRRIFGQVYREIHQVKPVDYVFLPYLDYCLYAFGLLGTPFGSTEWGGICMRPSFHYSNYGVVAPRPKLAKVKQLLFLRLLQNKMLKSIYTIDELLHRFVAERHVQWAHRLQYAPDPAELSGTHTYESARREMQIPDGAIVVLVYGAIDVRKGLDVLVAALSSSDTPEFLHLLVVGKQSDSIQPLMNSVQFKALHKAKRCHIVNSFVDEAVQQMAFAASDVVWLGYLNHYSMSGVLVLACIADKPVITSNIGLIGWYTKNYKLGHICDLRNVRNVIESIFILGKKNNFMCNTYGRNFLKQNSWVKFIDVILKNTLNASSENHN